MYILNTCILFLGNEFEKSMSLDTHSNSYSLSFTEVGRPQQNVGTNKLNTNKLHDRSILHKGIADKILNKS